MIVSWLFLLRLLTLSVMFWNMLNVAQCTTDSITMSMTMPMVKIALASPALDYRYVIKSCIFKMNRSMTQYDWKKPELDGGGGGGVGGGGRGEGGHLEGEAGYG